MRNWQRQVGIGCAVAIAYVVSALLGFRVAFVAEQVTTVWPPTGIAEAALLLWGIQLWPSIWLAAFAVNVTTHLPIWAAAGVATGNTLEAVVAAWLLTRFAGFNPALTRTRDAEAFICVGVAATPAISATLGTAILCASGAQSWWRYVDIWPEWWFGDALGALVVAPALLTTLRSHPRIRLTRDQMLETIVWIVIATIIAGLVFGPPITPLASHFPWAFTIFPLVIAPAVRLGQPAPALVILATILVTLSSTIRGFGPFMNDPVHERLILAQVFTGVLAGSGLLLAAAIAERRTIERRRAAEYGVTETLSKSESVTQATEGVLSAIGTNLDWQVGALWLLDTSADQLRCVTVWSLDPTIAPGFVKLTRELRLVRGVGLPGRVWASGQAAWIENVVVDPNFPRAQTAWQEGLRGAFGFPVHSGKDILGVVEFFNRSVTTPDKDLLATMSSIGDEIGQFIDRKRIEAAVAESQSRTRAILDTALDAIISMDERGMVVEFNPAAERMFGYDRDEVLGRELASLIIPASLRAAHRRGLQAYLGTGSGPFIDRRMETTAIGADGKEFPVELSITRVPIEPPVFTGFVRDVTARAAAEQERQLLLERELVARRQAEFANRAKDDFLATLSHELRTPLNAIVGWTRMLLDGSLDESTEHRALQIIDRNAQTQVQLVEDILDVSRIITGKLGLDIRPVDLGAIVGAVLDGARPAAEAKHIQVNRKIDSSARLTAGDPKRLQQIVWNLVSNAVKFTPQSGTIGVELFERDGATVCIKVEDNGVGLSPEFLPHLFERFTQADSSTTRQHGGLGLGLAIVRHLVELHGGTIRAESAGHGQGSTFIVELPRLADEVASSVRKPVMRGRTDEGTLRGCSVLVVEDEADAGELVSTILASAGAAVRVVTSAEQALASLDSMNPDVLLSDIGLTTQDGYALIRQVRMRYSARGAILPAVAVTAYARDEDRSRALDAGFDRYLPKPIDPAQIVETVRALWKR